MKFNQLLSTFSESGLICVLEGVSLKKKEAPSFTRNRFGNRLKFKFRVSSCDRPFVGRERKSNFCGPCICELHPFSSTFEFLPLDKQKWTFRHICRNLGSFFTLSRQGQFANKKQKLGKLWLLPNSA